MDKEKDYLSDQYLKINYKEEKEHLRFKPKGIKNGLTIKEGSIFFSVKWILDSLLNGFRYDIKDVLTCRISAVMGEAIAKKYERQLREGLKDIDIKEVLKIDYVILQEVTK